MTEQTERKVTETIEVPIHATVTIDATVDAVLFGIAKLELRPGDILVVAVPESFSWSMQRQFNEALAAILSSKGIYNELLVLPGGVQVGVIHRT